MTAFEEIVVEATPSVYRLARAWVGEASAPDIVQDTFLAAWRELPRLRNPDRFGPWLHRIALNRCRSFHRSQGRVREIAVLEPSAADPVAPDFRSTVEWDALVEPAFRALSEDHRALLALHYAAGLSLREIALALDLPDGTVKSRLNAALTALRRTVGERRDA
jgi:RNA polymerase sigma-70 factor (ECF subfamily)